MRAVTFSFWVWNAIFVVPFLHFELVNAEDFIPERTRLIDYYPREQPKNFLFRGNMPVSGGVFAYDSVVKTMKTIANQKNLSLPGNFSLLDVSYLNVFEESDMKIEENFFKANPNLGLFHNRLIVGSEVSPPKNDLTLIKELVKVYVDLSIDNLPSLMEYFHKTLQDVQDRPTVIYSHCEAGTDRTGEVSGAYYMKYLNMTFHQALEVDNHIQSRDMYNVSRNAMQWYCFYLYFNEEMKSLDCLL